jgi:hypothetical protein
MVKAPVIGAAGSAQHRGVQKAHTARAGDYQRPQSDELLEIIRASSRP